MVQLFANKARRFSREGRSAIIQEPETPQLAQARAESQPVPIDSTAITAPSHVRSTSTVKSRHSETENGLAIDRVEVDTA